MPRVLTCIDEQPAPDGGCSQQAWIEVRAWPALPTLEQAGELGGVILSGLVLIRAMIVLLQPPKGVFNDP